MTKEGIERLEAELDYLVNVRRKENIEELTRSRGVGDISENTEYIQALIERENIELQISNLKQKLSKAVVVDEKGIDKSIVNIGAYVSIKCPEGEVNEYMIVGEGEGDIVNNKISISSPLGKAVLGKRKGVYLNIETPDGILGYEILDIKYS